MKNQTAQKFGTFLGVYVPSLLTILGLIMYLGFGWVVANVGLILTAVIVLVASAITFITALSASSIATNMHVGAGGEYFMVSRSLGLEMGGAIGIPLFLCRTLSITFYSFGLAEVVNSRNIEGNRRTWEGLRLPVDQDSLFSLVAEDAYYRGPVPQGFAGRTFFRKLALVEPREILLLPIYGEESLEAVLYGDGGAEGFIENKSDSHAPMLELASLAVRMLTLREQLCSA